jgi:hypothetical protein
MKGKLFYLALLLCPTVAYATECPVPDQPCKVVTLSSQEQKLLIEPDGILDTAAQAQLLKLGMAAQYFKTKIETAPNGEMRHSPQTSGTSSSSSSSSSQAETQVQKTEPKTGVPTPEPRPLPTPPATHRSQVKAPAEPVREVRKVAPAVTDVRRPSANVNDVRKGGKSSDACRDCGDRDDTSVPATTAPAPRVSRK